MVGRAVRSRSTRWLTAFAIFTTGCSLLTDLAPLPAGGGDGGTDAGPSSVADAPSGVDGTTATDAPSTTDSGNGNDAPASDHDPICTTLPFSTGTTAVNAPGDDDVAWDGLAGALIPGDGARAVSNTNSTDERSNRLLVRGFGFAIPAAAKIEDVTVEVTRSGVDHEDERIELVSWSGTGPAMYGANRSLSEPIPTTSGARTYSGSAIQWGMVLTPAIVNASSFGFAFAAKYQGGTAGEAFLDAVKISIRYCE
jgi:hypothetical protein